MKTIAYPFRIDSHGKVADTTDPRKVWQDRVRSVLNTQLGDRVMRPLFGLNSGASLLNMGTPAASDLTNDIRQAFTQWLPMIALNEVETELDGDSGVLLVQVWFTIPDGTLTNASVSFDAGLVFDESPEVIA